MKKINLVIIIVVGFILSGCSSNNSQNKLKEMKEIEKLSKEQFAEETVAIYLNVFKEIDILFDKHTKIDSEFEKEIDELYKRSMGQMVEYGKVLATKEEETRDDFIESCLMGSMTAMEKLGPEISEGYEKKLDERLPELEAYGSTNLEREFDDLYSIMDFLNLERIREERPESAKELGIE